MMMMTGRVLLVCALCVLWCGACGGGRAEPPSPDSPGTTPEKEPQNKEEPVGGAEEDVKNGQQKVPQVPAPEASVSQELPSKSSQPQQSGGGASKTPSKTTDNTDENAQEYKKEEKEEEKAEDEDEEEEEEEDDTKEEKEVDGANEEEEGDTKEEEAVTDTAEGTSAGGQEQPSLSSAAEGASNITNPNSTQTTGDDDPAADGAGTREEKQNENKDVNPKETPVTAAAMKTTTATTGDSDGSTAVSHTTSPLLLLLVVACAAAAAVVAA
ncbi:mucin-associated surface protein (MASP), putative [Trypanosoma cruzi]|nr:mucin-associated surface protein (MASP), putative [Trypanosoma cruzi]